MTLQNTKPQQVRQDSRRKFPKWRSFLAADHLEALIKQRLHSIKALKSGSEVLLSG